jgi:glycosyltransferase involved in cell wall biosynthesis
LTAPKVAFFVPNLEGGGAERVMVTLAGGFASRGCNVDLVVGNAAGPYGSQLSGEVRLVDLKVGRVLSAAPGLARYLAREKPFGLVSALPHANLVALLAARLTGSRVKVLVSEHSTMSYLDAHGDSLRSRLLPSLMRLAYPLAHSIVAVSTGVADDLAQRLALDRRRVRVVFNPVVTPDLNSRSLEPLDHPWFADGGIPVVLGVGRLEPEKDFETLLEAFCRLRRRRPARLVILGEGRQRPALEALSRRLGITHDVALPGFVANPFPWMRRASVFALSSTHEGLANVLIEAMACGTRVVSTDCPSGPSEVMDRGAYGPLVPPGDPDALAKAIEGALDDPQPPDVRHRAAQFDLAASVRGYREALGLPDTRYVSEEDRA